MERIRSPSVRNEARDEEEAAVVWSDGERSGRIEITSATERTGRRRRRRYAERGTWADRTRRAVARAHKLKPAPRRHCCLLRSTAPARPSSHALPHPPYRPSLRHPLWCPPNQPHPVPRRATPLLLPPPPPLPPSLPPSLSAPLPVHPQARETARCRTTEPPHVPTPPITRPPPILAPPPANPPCLPADSSSLCATPLSVSSLFRLPSPLRPSSLSLPRPLSCHYLATPGVTPFGQTSTPESRVRCGTRQAAPRLSFVRSYVARVCVRENAKGVRETEKGCARERTAI